MIVDILVQVVVFVTFLFYGSFFEWGLHKRVLHARFPLLGYAYISHQLEHHVEYRGDESFESRDPKVKDHGRFKAWDYLYLMLFHLPPVLVVGWAIGIYIAPTCMLGALAYTFAFDFLLKSYHVPRGRFYEKHGWFRWLKYHHRLHHRRQNRNLNVVFPLADFVFRTRIGVAHGVGT